MAASEDGSESPTGSPITTPSITSGDYPFSLACFYDRDDGTFVEEGLISKEYFATSDDSLKGCDALELFLYFRQY